MNWKKITGYYLVWRVGLFLLAVAAGNFLIYDPSFPYADSILPSYGLPQWLYSWANFDGVHYLSIAKNGYVGTGLIQAFFPLYPMLLRAINLMVGNQILAGLLLSAIFSFLLCAAWIGFITQERGSKIAWLSLLLLLVFPTSFYLTAVYTESLFLLLVITSFWAARRQQWLWATILAALAANTRVVGVLLVPALLLELFIQYLDSPKRYNWQKIPTQVIPFLQKFWSKVILISVGSLGLLGYMAYLNQTFADPLYFFHVQAEFGGGRQESIVLLPQVFWRYIKIMLTYRPIGLAYYASAQELVLSLSVLVTLLYSLKKIRWSYVLFSLMAFVVPTLTGTFSSMPRYVLVCFPIFILAAELLENRPLLKWSWIGLSTFWLAFNTILFIQGYWVA